MMPNPRPLEGITVLDLTTALAGPYATFLLAGLGARVIKIENPAGPDTCRANAPYIGPEGPHLTRQHPEDISVSAINRLRGKKAVTLNMKHPESRAALPQHFPPQLSWGALNSPLPVLFASTPFTVVNAVQVVPSAP